MIQRCAAAIMAVALQLSMPAGPANAADPAAAVGTSAIEAELADATAKARDALAMFWERQAHPGPTERGFALKVAIADEESVEYFWLVDVKREAGAISGIVDTKPILVKNVKVGDRVEVTEDQIADWLFVRNGKTVGNESMRPMLKRMPPIHAARFRVLYETP